MLVGLGALVMAGWYWESAMLVHLRAGWAPMQFNAALCFSLIGLGLLFGSYRVRSVELALGLVVALVAAATLSQFLVAGMVLVLGLERATLAFAAGSVIALNGVLYACAHLPPLAELGGWIGWTKIPLHACVGLVLLGVGFVYSRGAKAPLPHSSARRPRTSGPTALGAVLFLLVATAGVNLWQVLVHVEIVRVAGEARTAAQGLAQQLVRTHANRVKTIERMAARLERDPGLLDSGEWGVDARAYIDDIPGLLALAVHDARGFVLPPVTGP